MTEPAPKPTPRMKWLLLSLGLSAILCGLVALSFQPIRNLVAQDQSKQIMKEDPPLKTFGKAPDLDGGVAWINTGKPLTLKDLKGKVVLLDFWTLCCINCIHIFPDLEKLEKKYPNELVVIGVHSAKFDNEKNSESIRKAALRYGLKHPIVNDADQKIWDRYEADAWPTLVLIDPEGNLVGRTSGEGKYELLDQYIGRIIAEHKKKKTLDEKPLRFDTAKFRDKPDSPLYFPGKVFVDEKGKRICIADSTNHRIVITDLEGQALAVAGTGVPGNKDGEFDKAQFDDPQGMAIDGEILYVADRKNHTIRALDLAKKQVTTVAGTGEQDRSDRGTGGPALKRGLNSPWDLLLDKPKNRIFIAMAGHHQIWTLDLTKNEVEPFAGTGRENIKDGPHEIANFAQPSGLATDGKYLYVADCEVSAIRRVPMDGQGRVDTLVGKGLFIFGDRDGKGDDPDEETRALLQHAIGVAWYNGKVYVADTYNSKLRVIDPKTKEVSTFIEKGDEKNPNFNEPCGLSILGDKMYVADTNAHRIRIVDLKTKAISDLKITGVKPVEIKD